MIDMKNPGTETGANDALAGSFDDKIDSRNNAVKQIPIRLWQANAYWQFSELKNADVKSNRLVIQRTIGNVVAGYWLPELPKPKVPKVAGPWNHALGRMREIEKLIKSRHGMIIPETDDAWIYAEIVAKLLLVQFKENPEAFVMPLMNWCRRWMPWATKNDIETLAFEKTPQRFRSLTADALGHELNVSYAERQMLDLRTIGAWDKTKRQRSKIQKKKHQVADCKAKQTKRRSMGIQLREVYLAKSASRLMPWLAFGYSRKTWERNGKPMPLTMPVFQDNFQMETFVASPSTHNSVAVVGTLEQVATLNIAA